MLSISDGMVMDETGEGMGDVKTKDRIHDGISFIYRRRDGCL